MIKKMDAVTAAALKNLLQQYNINEDARIIIDLKNNLIDDYIETNISDLLSIRGTISDVRAKEWNEEVSEMRKEW